jgi:hypothetical protein
VSTPSNDGGHEIRSVSAHINTGGPAFPTLNGFPNPECDGMTLRDYFAGQALAGMIARGRQLYFPHDRLAEDAYWIADAMIARKELTT